MRQALLQEVEPEARPASSAIQPAIPPLRCSLGIMAFNEAQNIGLLLESLATQRLEDATIEEIVVVASGCTDGTEDVVRLHARRDSRIRLLVQPRREGKASAINLFLREARGDVIVLESADTLPAPQAFASLLAPFSDPLVGMTGARPRPVDPRTTVMGYSSHFLWSMHHTLALHSPKLGELVAFRRIVRRIPADTAVDEAAIEAAVRKSGYVIRYASDAIVFNKGPETLRDYLVQRRRIIAGHKHLARTQRYTVSSTEANLILGTFARKLWLHVRLAGRLLRRGQIADLRRFLARRVPWSLYVLTAMGIESLATVLGAFDYHVRGKNPFIWPIAPTTKRLR
jgi:cellulose synthase/poly-beta-1,6-N-acetylglucosamine synthase-like glycosyltransferase